MLLSHPLAEKTPGYGGSTGFKMSHSSKISEGASSNGQQWELSNHIGTHMDCPKHFDDEGLTMDQYGPSEYYFDQVCFIDMPLEPEHTITVADLENRGLAPATEVLIVKTHFETMRHKEEYWNNNPGFHPDVGVWLRENFQNLRFIGFDTISLTGYQNRPLGRAAHKAFLGPGPGKALRIIEDMKLSELKTAPSRILISPLFVENADGGPVTVWAW
jgi:kynurenine formamidase